MEYMLIFHMGDGDAEPGAHAEMGAFARELGQLGKMKSGAPLRGTASGARVRVRDEAPVVVDGPFSETKEVVGGFFIIDCDDLAEAIEWAKKCPHAKRGTVEVREVMTGG